VPAGRIVFAGVGKTEAEMELGLDSGILQFNVESEPELVLLSQVATRKGKRAQVALRVNPDVDAKTHAKITTGRAENKFGIDLARAGAVAQRAARLPGIAFAGVAVHIGSQLQSLDPYRVAFARVAALVKELRGLGLEVRRVDLGGGLGVGYAGEAPVDLGAYARIVRDTVGGLGCALIVEPGRILVAEAGLLLTRIIYVKQGAARRFVIVDAAMNDLIRPTLYEAYHPIRPVKAPPEGVPETPVDIVGPICETGDQFAAQRPMPPMISGDLLAVLSTGAYGFAMASTYNLRPLPAEVMVDGERFTVVRPRQSYDALLGADSTETAASGAPRAKGRVKSAT
jgi:diaminopimelate decarboxylase